MAATLLVSLTLLLNSWRVYFTQICIRWGKVFRSLCYTNQLNQGHLKTKWFPVILSFTVTSRKEFMTASDFLNDLRKTFYVIWLWNNLLKYCYFIGSFLWKFWKFLCDLVLYFHFTKMNSIVDISSNVWGVSLTARSSK